MKYSKHILEKQYDIIIFGAGQCPRKVEIIQLLDEAKHIIACDGALAELLLLGYDPEVVIGDGDSIPQPLMERYKDKFVQVDEQETNDLTKATIYAMKHFATKGEASIAYLAATGKREDHTIGNIWLLLHYYKQYGIKATMISDYGTFQVAEGKTEFISFPKQQVSIFNADSTTMRSEGLKWEVQPFDQLWQGTLNEAISDTFTIDADGHYIVYQTHEKKI